MFSLLPLCFSDLTKRTMKKLNLHRPIGISETKKGLSLSVADLLRKTSAQNLENLEVNSRLLDMFKHGLTEVEEDKLLDFLPLRTSNYRDLTDLEKAYEDARGYIREQFELYKKSRLASEQARRAALLRKQQRAQQPAQQPDDISTPARSRVETRKQVDLR